eukprot:10080_1
MNYLVVDVYILDLHYIHSYHKSLQLVLFVPATLNNVGFNAMNVELFQGYGVLFFLNHAISILTDKYSSGMLFIDSFRYIVNVLLSASPDVTDDDININVAIML